MAGSEAEREIREAVVEKLRRDLPSARIIHELNTCGSGSRRIDVAAVTKDTIYGVEIKSERDKLDRLKDQVKAFRACCHHVIVVAHRKFFKEEEQRDGGKALWWNGGENISAYRPGFLWCYPKPEQDLSAQLYQWTLPPLSIRQPAARDILGLLWADELTSVAARLRIGVGQRDNMETKMNLIAYNATGKEIAEAACAELRRRQFAEADAPIEMERNAA